MLYQDPSSTPYQAHRKERKLRNICNVTSNERDSLNNDFQSQCLCSSMSLQASGIALVVVVFQVALENLVVILFALSVKLYTAK
jgi:hypothetical protein